MSVLSIRLNVVTVDISPTLTLRSQWIPRVMDLNVFVVIRLGGRRLAANVARERPLASVYAPVLGQVIRSVEFLVADITSEVLLLFVLARVPHPVRLAHKLAAAVIACVRPYRPVRIHVRDVVVLTDKCVRTHGALERFRRPVRVRPLVLLQVPLGAELLVANLTRVLVLFLGVRLEVGFKARLQVFLVTVRTRYSLVLQQRILVWMRQPDVACQAVAVDEAFAAEWTHLGLFLVRLFVPVEFGLRNERFATLAYVVFLVRALVQVVPVAMLCQVGVAAEAGEADIALDWSDTCKKFG